MEDIDPAYILQPAAVVVICVALLLYFHRRQHYVGAVLAYSFIAYAVAIAAKYAIQIPTINAVLGYFGDHSVGLGVYYGLQTVFLEVGLAYVVVRYAARKGKLARKDAWGYGAGLAFWENAVLLGAIPLLNLVTYYVILGTNNPLAQTVYQQLITGAPSLFDPPSKALATVTLGTVERISSILLHLAWGYLCVMAAVYGRRRLFLIALPMGFVDFLVPFSTTIGLVLFEAILFVIAVAAVLVGVYATRRLPAEPEGIAPTAAPPSTESTRPLTPASSP